MVDFLIRIKKDITFIAISGQNARQQFVNSPFGDSDTLVCIGGGIAEAFHRDVPGDIRSNVRTLLTPELQRIREAFGRKYPIHDFSGN